MRVENTLLKYLFNLKNTFVQTHSSSTDYYLYSNGLRSGLEEGQSSTSVKSFEYKYEGGPIST